jgi:hypothetical protein
MIQRIFTLYEDELGLCNDIIRGSLRFDQMNHFCVVTSVAWFASTTLDLRMFLVEHSLDPLSTQVFFEVFFIVRYVFVNLLFFEPSNFSNIFPLTFQLEESK